MKILDRYLGSVLMLNFLYALTALVAIFSVLTFTEELRNGQVSRALGFVLMTLPAQAYSVFPASALLGTVMGLGQLMRHHELVAIQAAGVSRARLARTVATIAVLIALAGVGLGEIIAAPLSQRAHARRALVESGGQTLSTTAGLWVRDGSRFVNVGQVRPDGSLGDLYVFDFGDVHTLRRFIRAGAATRVDDAWTLTDVQESVLSDAGVQTQRAARETWDAPIDVDRLKALWLQPEDVSAVELRRTVGWLQRHEQNPIRYQLAFWRRVSAPLYTVVMVMLALPIVLMSGPRARLGEYIVRGVIIGIGFQMLQQTFSNFGLVAGLPPLLTALAPAGVAIAAITILFRRQVAD